MCYGILKQQIWFKHLPLSVAHPTVLLHLFGNGRRISISGAVGQRTPCHVRIVPFPVSSCVMMYHISCHYSICSNNKMMILNCQLIIYFLIKCVTLCLHFGDIWLPFKLSSAKSISGYQQDGHSVEHTTMLMLKKFFFCQGKVKFNLMNQTPGLQHQVFIRESV